MKQVFRLASGFVAGSEYPRSAEVASRVVDEGGTFLEIDDEVYRARREWWQRFRVAQGLRNVVRETLHNEGDEQLYLTTERH